MNEFDNLAPQDLIKYLQTNKYNRLINGYNFIFFGTSGIVTFGIGMLFLKVIDLGLISNIITVISFTSSAIGISAAGYYGYKYIDGKRELHRIVELDKGISLNGDINNDNIDIEIELTF